MIKNKKRKEVTLTNETIAVLNEKAKSEGRTLKNYMEFVLSQIADEVEKKELDKTLEIRKALVLSKAQSRKGQVKPHEEVISTARKRIHERSLD